MTIKLFQPISKLEIYYKRTHPVRAQNLNHETWTLVRQFPTPLWEIGKLEHPELKCGNSRCPDLVYLDGYTYIYSI